MKYAQHDDTGKIIGFYTPEIHHNDIPLEATIEITDEQWQAILKDESKYSIDIVNKALVTSQ
jgi:hypothetical protein